VLLGGYSPPGSTHSLALRRIASLLEEALGADVRVDIDYNVLDTGRGVRDLLQDVEAGRVTACYLSTAYLVDRVPELSIIDLPYTFDSLDHAHRCLDGELGRLLSERTAAVPGLRVLGYWDNGIRHLSNRLREVRRPRDCRGLRIRLQPNWAHERFFQALGTIPICTDLKEGIEIISRGAVDAQENPLANFVGYGVDRLHPYVTLTGHAYGARGVYASEVQLRTWPAEALSALEQAVSVAAREQRVNAARVEEELRADLESSGTSIVSLDPSEELAFRDVAAPIAARARQDFALPSP
jgi:TRAP-type transport system periplasmic protein